MKTTLFFIFTFLLNTALYSDKLEDEKIDIFCEYAGTCIGEGFQYLNGNCNIDAVIRGLKKYNQTKKETCDFNEDDMKKIIEVQDVIFTKVANENLKKAEDFLKNLSSKSTSVSISEKLFYEILKEGKGKQIVQKDSTPLIFYSAKTVDEKEIINTFDENEPDEVPIIETIEGFSNGVIGMKEGEIRRIYIHPDLAYKRSGNLPPNSLLILEVEVVKIKP